MTTMDDYARVFALIDRASRWTVAANWPDIEDAVHSVDNGHTGEVQLTHPICSGWLHLHLHTDRRVQGLLDVPLDPRFMTAVQADETGFLNELVETYSRITERHAASPYVESVRSPSTVAEIVIPPDSSDETVEQAARELERIDIAITRLNVTLRSVVRSAPELSGLLSG